MANRFWLLSLVGWMVVPVAIAAESGAPTLLWKVKIGYVDKPTIGDADGDGRLDLIVGTGDGVYALEGATGKQKWHFVTEKEVLTCPTWADLDGDGRVEIIFGASDYHVYAVSGTDGTLFWKFRTKKHVKSSPAVADLDGDGRLEVLCGSSDGHLYALDGPTGEELWKAALGKETVSPPAVADISGDGVKDAILGCHDGVVYAFSGQDGQRLWKTEIGGVVGAGPVVVTMGGQQRLFISANSLVSLAAANGQILWRFVAPTGRGFSSPPSLGDVDGDGQLEVVIHGYDAHVYAVSAATGQLVWKSRVSPQFGGGSAPAIADLDGDGHLEAVVASPDNKILALRGKTGKPVWQFDLGWYTHSCPALADLDGDGALEIVVGCADHQLYALRAAGHGKVVWPKYHGDVASTGVYQASVADGTRWAAGKPADLARTTVRVARAEPAGPAGASAGRGEESVKPFEEEPVGPTPTGQPIPHLAGPPPAATEPAQGDKPTALKPPAEAQPTGEQPPAGETPVEELKGEQPPAKETRTCPPRPEPEPPPKPTLAALQGQQTDTTYREDRVGFTVKIPETWQFVSDPRPLRLAMQRRDRPYRAWLEIVPTGEKVAIQDFAVDYAKGQRWNFLPGLTREGVQQGFLTLDALYQWNQEEGSYGIRCLYIRRETHVVILALAAPAELYSFATQDFAEIVRDLVLTRPEEARREEGTE